MGFLNSIIDLYENLRPSKRKNKKSYEADSSGFTGRRKDDLDKFKVKTQTVNVKLTEKKENPKIEAEKER